MQEIHRPIEAWKGSLTEQTQQVQPRMGRILLGKLRMKPGLSLFEFDPEHGTLGLASYEKAANMIGGGIQGKLIMKPGCRYVQALNFKNALRKLLKA